MLVGLLGLFQMLPGHGALCEGAFWRSFVFEMKQDDFAHVAKVESSLRS